MAKLAQYIGPFKMGDTFTFRCGAGNEITHVGIQIPHRQPVGVPETIYYENNQKTEVKEDSWRAVGLQPDLEIEPESGLAIDQGNLIVNSKDILEFDNLSRNILHFVIKKNLPAETIIDISYRKRNG